MAPRERAGEAGVVFALGLLMLGIAIWEFGGSE